MATYRKRDDKWEARINYKSRDGKYKQKAKRFDNKRDANKWASEQELFLKDGLDSSGTPLVDYFTNWYELYKKPSVTHRTQMTYKHSLAMIKKYFGKTKIKDLTTDTVQEFVNAYAKGTVPFEHPHAKETVAKLFTHLKGALKKAVKDGIFRYNPADDVKVVGTVAPRSERLKFLNEADQLKLRTYLLENLRPSAPIQYMILTALDTGMRLGELLGLKWEDVHKDHIFVNHAFDYTKMELTTTKHDNPRDVTITTELYNILKQLKKRDYVFASRFGDPLSTSFVSREFNEIERAAGIENPINFHGLRHSHASLMLYKGMNIKSLAKRLGHRDVQTTMRVYSHIIEEMDEQQNKLVDQTINDQYSKVLKKS